MTHRMYGALIASAGAAALLLAATETFAKSGATPRAPMAAAPSMHRPLAPHFRHHRRNFGGTFWPGSYYYPPSNGEPVVNVPQHMSGDFRYTHTYTYDVPWDWAHRFPPAVAPSDRPYVSSCPAETVTVPGRDGKEHTVNVMRCY
nr:hypothetical protein [Bradyrhizobium sp.]